MFAFGHVMTSDAGVVMFLISKIFVALLLFDDVFSVLPFEMNHGGLVFFPR